MIQTAEQIIEIVKTLPKPEREKVRDWLDENQDQSQISKEDEKFRLALKWVDEHRQEFDGQWVVLDGNKLVSHGKNAKEVYDEARAKGIKVPFLKRVKSEILPWGGW